MVFFMLKIDSTTQLKQRLIDIVGDEFFSDDPEILTEYEENPYHPLCAKKRKPNYLVMPREVEEIVQIIKDWLLYEIK